MRRFTRRTAIGASVLVVTLSGGAAFAYWLNSATTTGEAQTARGATAKITDLVTGSPALTPGGTQVWSYKVINEGDSPFIIDTVASTVTVKPFSSKTVDPAKDPCTEADYEIDPVAKYMPSGVSAHSNADGYFTLRFLDRSVDQVNCQGVKVPLQVNVKSPA